MRKFLKRYLPNHDAVRGNRWLAPFGNSLLHPRLWHLNRHSAAGAVAVGLFCGLIPGPFQMLGAALACVILRVNLPLALITTLYSNPLTIVPLYFAAYSLGELMVEGRGFHFQEPPGFSGYSPLEWVTAVTDWLLGMGEPLALGLPLLGIGLAAMGYGLMKFGWRLHILHVWRRRASCRDTTPALRRGGGNR
jgi:uncharacterized protein (DUF2062 family)